jgi:hypothetical protein
MSEEIECAEGEKAAGRFLRLAKKVTSVSKSEIDRRARQWREAKDAEKSETASE